ncbi:DUF6134 family protein [Zavarzinia sp. CC-PAN008]|uniref:DUF6134 family protein n=1 Tax=Zavarzinia sp. CC-PAN008 TaxID=3243332 RepID=UPI003F749BAF
MRNWVVAGLILAAGVVMVGTDVLAAEHEPPAARLDYEITRDGGAIGRQVFTFDTDGAQMSVRHQTEIDVRIAFIRVYAYRQEAVETWRDGRLVAVTANTDDDGDIRRLQVRADAGGLVIDGSAHQGSAMAEALPNSYWNVDTVRAAHLIDIEDGTPVAQRLELAGAEMVQAAGQTVQATRYRMVDADGALKRELWYDSRGLLVRIRVKGSDGSIIEWGLSALEPWSDRVG